MITTLLQVLISSLSVIAAGVVLATPILSQYRLQFFAVFLIGFVLVNRLTRKQSLDYRVILEKRSLTWSWQLFFAGAAILLMIGGTGGLASWLLPLVFVYLLFLSLVNGWLPTIITTGLMIFFLYAQTGNFGADNYGAILSIVVFVPIAFFAQKYYVRFVRDQEELKLEREKITYYNLYAEKQQNELLTREKNKANEEDWNNKKSESKLVQALIPQIDELQKESRFPENQLVVSARLTKIGLALRRFLKEAEEKK